MPNSIPLKTCNRCEQEKPATTEFFRKCNRDAFYPYCRVCAKIKETYEPVPDGYKRCTICKKVWPNDADHYHRWFKTLRAQCKECVNASDRERSHKETLEKQAIRALSAPPPGMKECPRCHEIKPWNADFFYRRSYAKTGFMPECKVCGSKRTKEWREETIEVRLAKAKIYKDAHREDIRAKSRVYGRAHNAEKNAAWHRREAKKRQAGGSYTPQQIEEQYSRQRGKCYYCKKKIEWGKHHIDHVFPVSRAEAGDMVNDISNLVIACPPCNKSKGSKLLHEWAEGGRLF